MKINLSHKITGPVFLDGVIKHRVIQPAINKVSGRALDLLREFTPVDTGASRAGWQRLDPRTLYNEVEYIDYLEYGTRYMEPRPMAQKAAPIAERELSQEVSKQVGRLN